MNNYDILIKVGDVWTPYNFEDIIIQFTTSSSNVKPNDIIYFYDSTWPKPKNVIWLFGDGAESNEINTTHTYKNEGTYSVALIVNYDVGSLSKTFVNSINVDNNNIDPVGPTFSVFD
jgi:PKD repeat protein